MAHLDRNGELAFGDDPDNATGELMSLRAQVAALTAERDEARRYHSVLHDCASGGCLHTLLRYEHACAVDSINGWRNRAEAAEAKAGQASAFEMGGTEGMHWSDTIRVERVRQRDGGFLWAVRCRDNVMDTTGEWDYEPIPSSRTDDFLARYRFPTLDAALAAARAAMGEG